MATRQRWPFWGRPARLAELLAHSQVLPGRVEVALLADRSLIPTCMSAAPAEDRPATLGRQRQAALVGGHRVAQTALRDPDVGHGEGTPETSEA